jgi:ribokinase
VDRLADHPAQVQILLHALEKLRTHEGITVARLDANPESVADPLLDLHSVDVHAAINGTSRPRALFEVISRSVQDHMQGTDLLIADIVLGLGILNDSLAAAGIPSVVLRGLQSRAVTVRREALLRNWNALCDALGLDQTDPPSDRHLRSDVERRVLGRLALLLNSMEDSVSNRRVKPSKFGRSQRVIVVGGAVMDATFRTTRIPALETSVEGISFRTSPGGKGFYQAIAAGRLGLEVSLVAAIGGDDYGKRIVAELLQEGIDTSMMKVVPDVETSFNGIIELTRGASIAVHGRKDRDPRISVEDIDAVAADIAAADAVLITFEIPQESLQRTLDIVHATHDPRPVVVVTPGQPYGGAPGLPGQVLEKMDCMVAHKWEIESYASDGDGSDDLKTVAQPLRALGVSALCILDDGKCVIFSDSLDATIAPTGSIVYRESSVARDSFCAALVARLVESRSNITQDDAVWATAAMVAATNDFSVPKPMPNRERIQSLLQRLHMNVKHLST